MFLLFTALFFLGSPAFANNLSVSNVSLVEQDTSTDTIDIEFDISWDNSWSTPTNHDAAWVFFKYSTDSGTTWSHATLKTSGTNPSGFVTGTPSSSIYSSAKIVVPSDKKGMFAEPGHEHYSNSPGTFNFQNVQAVWDYAADGLSDATAIASTTQVKIFAIEMVYIPTGSFWAGDTSSTYTFKAGSSDTNPWPIRSETGIQVTGATSNGYYYTSGSFVGESATGANFEIPSSFPKGYQAFYLMKYEITQGQWVDFFNTLTSAQKTNRDTTSNTNGGKNSDSTRNRNTINWTSGDATTADDIGARPDRAMSYIGWLDVAAYTDWAALRPMTELEFEKAARGPVYPVGGEYAWGSASYTAAAALSAAADNEDGTETVTTSSANVHFGNNSLSGGDQSCGAHCNKGPVRAGIFATGTAANRNANGAGYYGNMELSGNIYEYVVTVGHPQGRNFTGSHGDGKLTSITSYEGNANNVDWPGFDSANPLYGVTGGAGSGVRGGSWTSASGQCRVSDRSNGATNDSVRYSTCGGRLARTAP